MENSSKPRAPLELSLVEIDPAPDDAANAASAADPMSLESVTLQPYSDRRPKPAPTPPGSLTLSPLDSPSRAPSGALSLSPLEATALAPPEPGMDTAPPGVPVLNLAAGAKALTASAASGATPMAGSTTSGTTPMAASTMSGTDRYLVEAAREYDAGRIDQPLWMRAAAQAGGNETVARDNYLRARATALKLARREQRGDPASRAGTAGSGNVARIGANLAGRAITGAEGSNPRARTSKYVAMAAGVAIAVAAAGWWFGSSDASSPPASVAAVARPVAGPSNARAPAPPPPEDHAQYFGTKVHELKSAGNWNVLVLYASEWTRKQPESATAWRELSIGYSNMRQLEDALQAAIRAAELAPQDPASWRNLGQVNVSLDQPADALTAFEKAAALDDRDLPTWVQAGQLNTRLDRLAEARAAFDKVLAVSPDHVGALCGKAQLAQRMKLPKEAEAIARQVKAADGQCRDAGEGAAVAVATGSPAPAGPSTTKSATSRSR